MPTRPGWTIAAAICVALSSNATIAGAQGKGNQGAGSGAQAPASGGLQGLSLPRSQWAKYLTQLPHDRHLVVLCYRMMYTNSASQPFVLQPTGNIVYPSHRDSVPCTVLDDKHNLQMDQLLVIAIDAQNIALGQLKILNINATDQQGTSINPTPVRPSFGASLSSTSLPGDQVYFLTWPNRIPGDVIRTISINAVFTPAAPGSPWHPLTFYPAGSVVTDPAKPSQYYVTPAGGVSSNQSVPWTELTFDSVADGTLTWRHVGASLPSGAPPASWWGPNKPFHVGEVILAPNSHYYQVIRAAGISQSGTTLPTFPITVNRTSIMEPSPQPPHTLDGTVEWVATGGSDVRCGQPGDTAGWLPTHPYALDAVMCDPDDRAEYRVKTPGTSGATKPTFSRATPSEYQIEWTATGTIPPASVAAGQGPDQTVNLLTLQLPQSHTRSSYNLAAGVAFSTVRRPTFAVPPGLTGSPTTAAQVVTSDNLTIEPVLLLTFYPWPIDAEKACPPLACLFSNAPGVTLGLSAASPTSSFYLGLSFELLRNAELVLGDNLQLVQGLPNPPVAISITTTTATTRQVFVNGFFASITFNISGFIKGS